MNPIEVLEKKRDGQALTEEELRSFILQYNLGSIPDYQMSALLMAIYIRGMTSEETAALTRAMLDSGKRLKFDCLSRIPVDKHSTGGVGDKITLPLVPLVASFGVPVPMLSGRGLGHSGGTLDKLEAIPGFRVNLSLDEYRKRVETFGAVIMGQTQDLAPADRRIYALRDVTGTVSSIPLITASILSKKAAGGAQALVLDVKAGSGAFMRSVKEARALASSIQEVGRSLGLRIASYLTNMDQPLGRYVGNALEVLETLDILRGNGPPDTTELTLVLGAEMLLLAEVVSTLEEGRRRIQEAIEDGRGMEKFSQLVRIQGGNPHIIEKPGLLPCAPQCKDVCSYESGVVQAIDTRLIGLATIRLGAGRLTVDDRIDPRVGLEIHRKVGDPVNSGEPLVRMHLSSNSQVEIAEEMIRRAYQIGDEQPNPLPLILERLSDREA